LFFLVVHFFMSLANTKKYGSKLFFVGYVQQQKNNLDYLH